MAAAAPPAVMPIIRVLRLEASASWNAARVAAFMSVAVEVMVGGAIESTTTCRIWLAAALSSDRSRSRIVVLLLVTLFVDAPLGTSIVAVTRMEEGTTLSCTFATGTPKKLARCSANAV